MRSRNRMLAALGEAHAEIVRMNGELASWGEALEERVADHEADMASLTRVVAAPADDTAG